ncbi:hypothetical protein Pfo_009026 [Paulownia fortunei]|nr:hypothetical protein Pfo_009026 [Paulownia fortunei]
MEALKRAYAEMILNTAKEAAARVMAAELRARRLEQDLVSTKEEAAGTLLRLKQMIDAKTKEAEITSLNQQRKFDELESQLNEAEGIILDLRAELNQAQEQLNEAKNKKQRSTRQNENAEVRNITPMGTYSGYELFTSSLNSGPEFITVGGNNSCLEWSTLNQKCFRPAKQSVKFNPECDVYSGDNHPVLDQIKEPELFRNGCTQRICATETSLVHEGFPVGDTSNPCTNSTNIEIVSAVGSTSVLEEKVQHGKNEAVSVVCRSLRKRKLKFWDDVITACGLHRSYQFNKPRQAFPHLSCDNTSKAKRCVKSGEDQFQAEDGTQIEESLDRAEIPKKELNHTEALPENMELIDVLVKQDELAVMVELTSSSRINCDVEGGTATKTSNLSYADGKKPFKYTFSRKWKKKSMIYPEKSSSFRERLLQNENGNSGFQNSNLLTES